MNKCLACKNDIAINPKSHSSNTRRYCSRKCYWFSLIGRPAPMLGRNAPWAKKNPQVFKVGNKPPKTAFKKGSIPWNKGIEWKEMRGKNHPNWNGGISDKIRKYNRTKSKKWSAEIFKRDGWTCRYCFKKQKLLHGHHIKSWKHYPELRFEIKNGITLCPPCHIKIHKKNDTLYNKKLSWWN